MALHQVVEDGLLGWLKGETFPSPPGSVYLSLHSGSPATAGNEISANFGGRREILPADFSSLTWESGIPDTSRIMTNSKGIVFDLAASTLEAVAFALWDAGTDANMLISGSVTSGGQVQAGDPAVLLAGELVVRTV